MGKLDGKVALVTGGGTGIGQAIVESLVASGARAVATGRRKAPLAELEARLSGVAGIESDVTRPGDPARAVALAVERFGRLDILVNNAGAFLRKPLGETTDADITAMLDVNVRGLLACSRDAVPHLGRTKGCIINISSAASHYARAGLAAYGAAKAAVNHATRILAVELGPLGIRVNAVAPGLTRTQMTAALLQDEASLQFLVGSTALRRVGEPEDVARVVAFLASDDAAWVTGQTIAASGGLLL